MLLTIYCKEDDKWLIDRLKSKAYGDRKSVSQVILTIIDEHLKALEEDNARPTSSTPSKKRGPKPGAKRKKSSS